jgi:Uma2 family endonuclease
MLLAAWQELDVPEGWRAEVIHGRIEITPPGGNRHSLIAADVNRQVSRCAGDGCGTYQWLAVSVPGCAQVFVPDLVVVPEIELRSGPDDEPVPAERALLVVEITSRGNADTDRRTKRWGYAHAGVPQYLLIDRFDEDGPAVMLFSEPVDGHYQHVVRIPFGERIKLHDPFAIELDTSGF